MTSLITPSPLFGEKKNSMKHRWYNGQTTNYIYKRMSSIFILENE
jgi:hypothetical protein